MSLLKRFAELYLNQPMLLSAGLLPELAYPVAANDDCAAEVAA